MKIIKRDGRAVDYDRQKIVVAIEKANKEVRKDERATSDDIKSIIEYIEESGKKRMLVEDVQDIIEKKLMEFDKYELAKKYIVYRYTRALVRKKNTTDESILGLIRKTNSELIDKPLNKNAVLASRQRDLIAGEVSKDLTQRMLLPEKITKAHEEGVLYFHNADYFLQPIFNSCLINMEDMLDNGTVINGNLIESPKSFQVACTIITQIIASVASSQYGGQSVDIQCLGKYLRKSYEKIKSELTDSCIKKLTEEEREEIIQRTLQFELKQGVQTLQYQINTLMTSNGKSPFVILFLNLQKDDEYIKENAMIIEEILKQREQGIKDEKGTYITPKFPKLVYVLDENNCLKGGEYDYLTKFAIKCAIKQKAPYFISAKKMRENYAGNVFSPMGCMNFLTPLKEQNGKYKFKGRFNQGVVSINLPQIGIIAEGNEEIFWNLLNERLELCKEALMYRHYSLLGTTSDVSPIHWIYGAISRLQPGEKIDKLLKFGYSTLSLGYIGIYEVTMLMKGVSHTTKEGHDFAIKIMKYLNETVSKWKKETELDFTLYGTPGESIGYIFAQIDKERFGRIKDITDKGYYTNSYHIDTREKTDVFSQLTFESEFGQLSLGGTMSYIELPKYQENSAELEDFIRFAYDNVIYVGFNSKE